MRFEKRVPFLVAAAKGRHKLKVQHKDEVLDGQERGNSFLAGT